MELQNSKLSELDNRGIKLKQNYSNATGSRPSITDCGGLPTREMRNCIAKTVDAQKAWDEKVALDKKNAAAALKLKEDLQRQAGEREKVRLQNEKDRIKAQQDKDLLAAENKKIEIAAEIEQDKIKAKLPFFKTPSGKAVIIGTVATILVVASVIVLKKYKAKKALPVKTPVTTA